MVNDVNAGEALIKDLGERNIAIERSLNDARTINEGYTQLIKALKSNPPFKESHVKSLEIGRSGIFLNFRIQCLYFYNSQSWSWRKDNSKIYASIGIRYIKTLRNSKR